MTSQKTLEQVRDELKRKHDVNNNPNVFSPWSFDASTAIWKERTDKLVKALEVYTTAMPYQVGFEMVREKWAEEALAEFKEYK